MHKDELVALCQSEGLPFALDPTNQDTFFSRNRLRKLMGNQQAIAACMPQRLSDCSPSQEITELVCQSPAAQASTFDLPQRVGHGALSNTDPGQQTVSRALTADVLRVMAACSAASVRLKKAAELVLEHARVPSPSTLLDVGTLRRSSKHVAVRALSKALVVRVLLSHAAPCQKHCCCASVRAAVQSVSFLAPHVSAGV